MKQFHVATLAMSLALSGCAPPGIRPGHAMALTFAALRADTPPAPAHAAQPFRRDARLAVTWIGHATALIQLDDKVVITDPVFTSRVGGLSPRLVAPGLQVSELPQLDAAVVSHMHFDHLSFDSLRMIASRTKALLLPAGGRNYVHDYSFDEIELGHWQSWEQGGLRITAVPVIHRGWRWGIDAFWSPQSFTGYVIEYHGLSVYFGGDTALDELTSTRRTSASRTSTRRCCPLRPWSRATS
ncbi:MAG: MBL fold metallo-hydrolase [Deltaproteobacteria bacterium]|nr:MBL fold metallo-hydrolase [Deltaproteobacteria bacterium]